MNLASSNEIRCIGKAPNPLLHEEDVYIARIDVDESGEEVYVDPTDEEFEQVREAYEELMEEEEDEAE
ncbi:DUF1292 domain-containing protein [bacterium BFN5]|nr:DUF1292 domain-containing protein [bacterium BFN5]